MMAASYRLDATGLHFRRGQRLVINNVDVRLNAGEIIAVLGENGAGKSTLFRILLGFLQPAAGEVRLEGKPLRSFSRREVARRIAYVPQLHVAPFPYTVREVVLMGLLPATGIMRGPSAAESRTAEAVLEQLRIGHLARRPYTEISGGERQLALIGRALAQQASVLVMDEPMSGLDYGYQVRLSAHFIQLVREGRTILFSTHSPDQAMRISTRIIVLHKGAIVANGAPADVVTPALFQSLYGVAVSTVTDAKGRTAVIPDIDEHWPPGR